MHKLCLIWKCVTVYGDLSTGIVLSWNMAYSADTHATISSYHLFAYQETSAAPLSTLWKKASKSCYYMGKL